MWVYIFKIIFSTFYQDSINRLNCAQNVAVYSDLLFFTQLYTVKHLKCFKTTKYNL